MMKKFSSFSVQRINQLINSNNYNKKFFIHYGVLIDSQIIFNLINKIRPDEIYNLVSRNYKSHN
jgi:GDPmannose 4,6-dehydratase